MLAGIPDAPPSSVVKVLSDKLKISVEMPAVLDNAGSTLLSYDLHADDGQQGEMTTYYAGLNRTVDVETVLGRTYRFRYRVSNILGWSEFSDVTHILAAYVPDKPSAAPLLVSVDATQITISLAACSASNGDLVTHFVLYMQTDFTGTPQIQGVYSTESNIIELTQVAESLVAGTHYFFYYKYRNSEGDSPASDVTEIALADYPAKCAAPFKDDLQSTTTSVFMKWNNVAFTEINIIGYELWMDSGSDGLFNMVFDGKNQPGIMEYHASGL